MSLLAITAVYGDTISKSASEVTGVRLEPGERSKDSSWANTILGLHYPNVRMLFPEPSSRMGRRDRRQRMGP